LFVAFCDLIRKQERVWIEEGGVGLREKITIAINVRGFLCVGMKINTEKIQFTLISSINALFFGVSASLFCL
jgi:hypothetical protein